MRLARTLTVAAAVAAAAAGGCDLYDPLVVVEEVCEPGIAVAVGEGLQPVLSWSPQCRVGAIIVASVTDDPLQAPEVAWNAFSPERGIPSPVRIGSPRDDGPALASGVQLVAGRTYRVRLMPFEFSPRVRPVAELRFVAAP